MLTIQESWKHDSKSLDALAGRLACWWFLLTACGLLWVWPVLLAVTLYTRSTWLVVALLMYMAHITVGSGAKAARSCAWPSPLRRWSLWRVMASYFNAQLVKTADLDPEGHYLFAVHPHGIIAISSWLNFVTEATGFSQLFPGISVHVATLEANFRVPLLREYILAHGMVDASKDTLKRALSGPAGRSALLVVGGAAEALLASPGTYDLILRARKGFVRLALQTGASLVPVIAYGETDTFHTYIPAPGSWMARLIRHIKGSFRFSTPFFWGVGVFGGGGMMPLPAQLVSVVGAPIAVQKTASPTEEQVDRLHEQYIAAVKKLWDDTSDKYGKGVRRELAIVQ